jgi:S-adenosylhomocysteine hydrolase
MKPTAAAGIFVEKDDRSCRGKCLPTTADQSQHAAELYAALEAIRCTDKNTTLTIVSTQDHVCDAMNKLSGWEHEGWVGVSNRNVLRCMAAELKARKAPTIFEVAEPGSPDRERCR